MGMPLWTPPPGKLDKPALPARCDPPATASTVAATTAPPLGSNLFHYVSSAWGLEYSPPSSSSSSSSSSGSVPRRHSRLTDIDPLRRTRTGAPPENIAIRSDSSMLTLDEFLRETSAASATRDEAERHLSNLLSLRRRIGATDPLPPPPPPPPQQQHNTYPEGQEWRALVEHTPAGRARIMGALPQPSQVGPVTRTVPYTYTPLPVGHDSFDTLVGQIRRIGALQDFMLSGVAVEGAAMAATTATLEEEASVTQPAPAEEEGERNAVAALRVREARLRAMQNRIDLLASEFALLRSTRRELRRVEAEALSTLQTASARNAAALSAPPATRRAVTRSTAAIDRYITSRRALAAPEPAAAVAPPPPPPPPQPQPQRFGTLQRAEWGRQGAGRREGDAGMRWTAGERDSALRREVVRMAIERLPAGGIGDWR